MDLSEHIHIVKELRFQYKANIIRILWHILDEHKGEIEEEARAAKSDPAQWFIDQVMPPRRQREQESRPTSRPYVPLADSSKIRKPRRRWPQ